MNRSISRRTLLAGGALGSAALPLLHADQGASRADVVVYGATPGGIATAVSAARLGRTVILCDYEDHIGGIVSNGLTNADIGKRQAVGGLFYEFTRRVVRRYTEQDAGTPEKPNVKLCRDGYWYEPSAAEEIFHQMIREQSSRIRLFLSQDLKQAVVANKKLTGLVVTDRANPAKQTKLEASVFVDATYEGDLAALAKVPFRTGRESRSEYGEPHAGRIYMRFGETTPLPGSTGEADDATQSYCFRLHVTNDPAKRVPIDKPAGFRREDYALTLEDARAGKIKRFRDVIQVYAMPNGRFELNSDHSHPDTGIPRESLDLAEECWPWPTGSRAERRRIYERYRAHNLGMIWLLQHDPDVPEAVRQDSLQYGLHRDEWTGNGNFPRQVYVRQGRRILGDYLLTEHDAKLDPTLQRTQIRKDSIAVLEWAFDPHAHHRYDPKYPGVREGYFFVNHEPFQVPYGVVVPKEIDGLLVPVACSCSHVAYNALRMEPVFIALGEACGIAAHLAITGKAEVRRVPTDHLQAILVKQKGVITFYDDLKFDDPRFAAFQWLGARGLNPGYSAAPEKTLSSHEAATRLARIFDHSRVKWKAPMGLSEAPGKLSEVAAWVRSAGLRAESPATDKDLTLADFAELVYAALAPSVA